MTVPPVDDFSSLSRRIARRTTDLIAISLIAIAGLVVARRVVVWWKTDPVTQSAASQSPFSTDALAPWGIGPGGATLDFADAPFTMRRQVLSGGLPKALDQLCDNCRGILQSEAAATPPGTAAEAESRLLRQLSLTEPFDVDGGGAWALYRLQGPLAMVIGVVRPGEPDEAASRVVCWGLTFPLGDNAWTLLTVEPRAVQAGSAVSGDEVPLPAGASRLMSVADELGGRLTTFAGPGPAAGWRQHFDREAERCGWVPLRGWRANATGDSAAWSDPARGLPRRIDVQLTSSEAGWSGLINISPETPKDEHP